MILEACISTIDGLKAAQKFSLDRVEICKDLHLEGLTPSQEFQSIAHSLYNGVKYVMIRPHNNGFQYNHCLLYTSDGCRRYSGCRSRWSPYH